MKNVPYEHFRPDEKAFVDRAVHWLEDAAEKKRIRRTDFLDPRQAFIVESLANRLDDVRFRVDGGYDLAERKRAILTPDFLDPEEEPAQIALLSITSDDPRIGDLDHGDYLGAVLGLGVKREKTGDIHVHEWGAHVLVCEELAEFFELHLASVGRVSVRTEQLPLEQLQISLPHLEELSCTVASLRLDGVLSEVTRLSRAKVLAPIRSGRCKVNWKVEEDPSRLLAEGDIISLQGYGRFKLLAVGGVSKKGRIRLTVGKFA